MCRSETHAQHKFLIYPPIGSRCRGLIWDRGIFSFRSPYLFATMNLWSLYLQCTIGFGVGLACTFGAPPLCLDGRTMSSIHEQEEKAICSCSLQRPCQHREGSSTEASKQQGCRAEDMLAGKPCIHGAGGMFVEETAFGLAGMLRSINSWSMKPLIFCLVCSTSNSGWRLYIHSDGSMLIHSGGGGRCRSRWC